MTAQPRVLYLGGFGRSGSTLLERILGQIPGWTNVGELVDLPRSVFVHQENCGCGEPFLTCPMWSQVGERAFGGWHDHDMQLTVALLQRTACVVARWPAPLRSGRVQRQPPGAG